MVQSTKLAVRTFRPRHLSLCCLFRGAEWPRIGCTAQSVVLGREGRMLLLHMRSACEQCLLRDEKNVLSKTQSVIAWLL